MSVLDILVRIVAASEALECGDIDMAAAVLRDLEDELLQLEARRAA